MNQDTSLLDSIIADIENGKNYDPKAEAENNANSLMDDIESIKDLINIYPNTNVEQNKGNRKFKIYIIVYSSTFYTHVNQVLLSLVHPRVCLKNA